MKFRLKVDISLVITFVILTNIGLINVLDNDMSCSSQYEVVTIIQTSFVDDVLVPNEYNINHNHTNQLPLSKNQTRLNKW